MLREGAGFREFPCGLSAPPSDTEEQCMDRNPRYGLFCIRKENSCLSWQSWAMLKSMAIDRALRIPSLMATLWKYPWFFCHVWVAWHMSGPLLELPRPHPDSLILLSLTSDEFARIECFTKGLAHSESPAQRRSYQNNSEAGVGIYPSCFRAEDSKTEDNFITCPKIGSRAKI